ncbi:MAG: lytic murein transglycosylase [Desulfobulbus propionicus]|nr:MAG: lytic murein transglycosylase [Desulfobulbus propionicus]
MKQLAHCSILPFFCLLVFGPYLSTSAFAASLSYYVNKYRGIAVNSVQAHRISRYNHLIEHFSSFAYIQSGHKVNPDFIRALMLAESNAKPRAVSSKGARGLCQIMFSTGKIAAQELAKLDLRYRYVSRRRLVRLKEKDLFSPSVNILLTCYLIAKYNDRFRGRLDLVVAAWNAGENSIHRSRVPQYKETLDLIGKVNGYFTYYHLRH